MSDSPPLPKTVELARDAAERLGWGFRVLDPEYGHLFEVDNGERSRECKRLCIDCEAPIGPDCPVCPNCGCPQPPCGED